MVEPKSLIQIITEEEFLLLAQEPCSQLLNIFFLFEQREENNMDISRKFYSNLIQESEFLESFMDEHGARENKKWSFFVEYLASIRNLSIAAFFTKHLLDRYPFYGLRESPENEVEFKNEANNVLNFLNQSILNLFGELYSTGVENGLNVTRNSDSKIEFSEIETNKSLPRNIAEDEVKDEEHRIIEICEKIKHVAKIMKDSKVQRIEDIKDLKLAVLQKFNEKRARMYKNLVHNIQSDFDTFIKNTKLEMNYSEVKIMRGYISMPLHLLEVALWLAHFYERHEDEIRHGESKKRISVLVNKETLLDKIMNFGFYYSQYFVAEGKKLADDILDCFSKIVRVELPIPQPLGFHARPSTYVSLIARQYDDLDLFIIIDGKKFNTKSVMSLLQAGGTLADKGYQSVLFEGDKRVIEEVRILAKHNYCEEGEIPARPSYLRDFNNSS